MNKFFKKSRIQVENLLKDIYSYTKEIYKQSDSVYTPASPYGQIMSVLAHLTQNNMFYIEDSITELNINTASRPNSIYGLSRLTGHNPTRAIASSGDLFLVYNGNIPQMYGTHVLIPNLIKLKCKDNNLSYIGVLGQDELKINLQKDRQKIFIKVVQGDIESQNFTGTGTSLQTYEVNMSPGKWIDNYFINVFVNSTKWKKYESLYDMPRESESVVVTTGITSGIDIQFGNTIFGKVPDLGTNILIEYLVTDGFAGNIQETTGILFEFDEPGYDIQGNEINLNDIFNIGIATPITFGSNPEPTFLTKLLSPTTSRSFVLANTGNYVSFFEKMQQFSYINVYTEFDLNDPIVDNIVFILLLPDIKKRWRFGENYFTVPIEKFVLTDLEKFKLQVMLEESGKKILGSIIYFINPRFKRYTCNIWLNVWENYDKQVIHDNIILKLSEYMSSFRRTDFLPKSDIIAIIENVDGVDSVNLEFVSEDIENELEILLNKREGYSLISEHAVELWQYYIQAENDGLILTTDDKIKKIMTYPEFREFVFKHIDMNGDIVLDKNDIPLLRGGWRDRNNKYYNDIIDNSKIGSVNIYYTRENTKNIGGVYNKLNVNNIRNN